MTNSEKASYECTLYIDTRLFREKATSGNSPKNINDKIVKKRPYMKACHCFDGGRKYREIDVCEPYYDDNFMKSASF